MARSSNKIDLTLSGRGSKSVWLVVHLNLRYIIVTFVREREREREKPAKLVKSGMLERVDLSGMVRAHSKPQIQIQIHSDKRRSELEAGIEK